MLPLSPGHILGTDSLGDDVLSRILYGGRVSLEVGGGSCFLGFTIGGLLGVFAGFKGGAIEVVIMRILDMFLAFPALVLAITIATYLGASELHVIWAISFFSVPGLRTAVPSAHPATERADLRRLLEAVGLQKRPAPSSSDTLRRTSSRTS